MLLTQNGDERGPTIAPGGQTRQERSAIGVSILQHNGARRRQNGMSELLQSAAVCQAQTMQQRPPCGTRAKIFGGRLRNVAQCVKFLLDEVEDASSNPWSPSENRQIPMPTWRKAIAFQKLLGTRRVVAVEHENGTYHVCRERKDPQTDDVSKRGDLKEGIARSVLREQLLLEAGKATACTWTQLARLQTFRFFTQDQCTCGAWLGPRLCFHTVAVQLAAGRRTKPQSLDETPLGPQLGHRPPKAPGRGAPAPKHVLLLVHKKKQAGNEFDLVAEVEVPTGSTVGEAVLAVGHCCSLPPISFRLRDLGALCEDPGGGLTAEEWLVGSTRVLEHEDFRLWLQVRLQGG